MIGFLIAGIIWTLIRPRQAAILVGLYALWMVI